MRVVGQIPAARHGAHHLDKGKYASGKWYAMVMHTIETSQNTPYLRSRDEYILGVPQEVFCYGDWSGTIYDEDIEFCAEYVRKMYGNQRG